MEMKMKEKERCGGRLWLGKNIKGLTIVNRQSDSSKIKSISFLWMFQRYSTSVVCNVLHGSSDIYIFVFPLMVISWCPCPLIGSFSFEIVSIYLDPWLIIEYGAHWNFWSHHSAILCSYQKSEWFNFGPFLIILHSILNYLNHKLAI